MIKFSCTKHFFALFSLFEMLNTKHQLSQNDKTEVTQVLFIHLYSHCAIIVNLL